MKHTSLPDNTVDIWFFVYLIAMVLFAVILITLLTRRDKKKEVQFEEAHEPETFTVLTKWYIATTGSINPGNGGSVNGSALQFYDNINDQWLNDIRVRAGYTTFLQAINAMTEIVNRATQVSSFTAMQFTVVIPNPRKLKTI